MRVLIACEFSGIVREAFAAEGHQVASCDLLDTEIEPTNGSWHFRCDVRDAIEYQPWDLMIAHPPCTYLCNSGVRWLYNNGRGTRTFDNRDKARWKAMEEAAVFFKLLLDAPIARICIENPVMHRYAVKIIGRSHDQTIQPWQFGHGETKRHCFWLKGLPPLKPTRIVKGREPRVHHASPGADRWKERSRTLTGIARAMARQWGSL